MHIANGAPRCARLRPNAKHPIRKKRAFFVRHAIVIKKIVQRFARRFETKEFAKVDFEKTF